MTKEEVEVLADLKQEYERVCDMFCLTPEKHWQWLRAKALIEEEEERNDVPS